MVVSGLRQVEMISDPRALPATGGIIHEPRLRDRPPGAGAGQCVSDLRAGSQDCACFNCEERFRLSCIQET